MSMCIVKCMSQNNECLYGNQSFCLYQTVLVYLRSLGSLIILVKFFYAAKQQVTIFFYLFGP